MEKCDKTPSKQWITVYNILLIVFYLFNKLIVLLELSLKYKRNIYFCSIVIITKKGERKWWNHYNKKT